MKKVSLPIKIGFLMTLAILLVSAAGYLTYNSLSSIVMSIQVKSKPDLRLIAIRKIAEDLDKAENSVRLYMLTRHQKDIQPYYAILDGIDDKIEILQVESKADQVLSSQIDTVRNLIEENMLIWNKMLALYHSDSLDIHIRRLSAKVAVATLNKKNSETSILKRVFGKKPDQTAAQREIINDLNRIEQQDSLKNRQLLVTESQLAATGNEIRDRLYIIISRMETQVISSIQENARAADKLALMTYRRLAWFALMGTLLVILVLIVVVRYVKKTREYQKALEKSKEDTEQLARTKELFMANMSHEIRTPVNAIYGFTEQLLYEPLDDKSRKMLGIVKSSAGHLVQVVNDILDFSKLQNSKIELEKVHFPIRPLCEELELLFAKKTLENKTKLYFTVSQSTPFFLLGDAYRLKQILMNLISNAVKFTSNGEIHVLVESESLRDKSFFLKLTIKDNGVGISKAMHSKVFDDFTQAEAGTSRKYGGTGLGLSIVKKLVELHQGEITLESREKVGTTITCRLPYETGNPDLITDASVPLQIPEAIRMMKILIVDDEEYNRMLFRVILSRWQVRFEVAEDGKEAIDMIRRNHYDMVFMDARMPVMDGLKTTLMIRGELGLSSVELPVIGISATHTSEDLKKYKSVGMNSFMPKPFTERILLETMISLQKQAGANEDELNASLTTYVNLDNLYHLANHDMKFIRQMLVSFIETTEHGLNSLLEAVEKEDYVTAGEVAHKISSPCKHLGANSLYNNLKSIEEQVGKMVNLTILADLSRVSFADFRKIKKELEDHLSKMEA